jgi:hypothetical protein
VLETFSAIVSLTVRDLTRRYRTMELPPGQTVEAWTKEAVAGMFGREHLDAPVEPAPAEALPEIELADGTVVPVEPSGHLRVRIPMPEDLPRAGAAPTLEVRSPESLAESYAEASAELGFVVSDLREERDAARVRLEEVRRVLELATESPGGSDIESRARRILQVLVRAAGASHAALRLSVGEATQILALPPLVSDPLSRTSWGGSHLEALKELAEPLVEEAVESAELTDALRAGEPSLEAVALVPLRSAERLLGLALLYYGPHAVLPSRDTLLHLGFLARVLAGPFEASAAREATSAADRLRVLSRASAAAVASLLARLPSESTRRQRLDLAEVLGPLRAPGVSVEVPSGTVAVRGDAPLLRFALATLVHQCEADALERGQVPEIVIRAAAEDGAVRVRVSGGGRVSVLSSPETGPDLSDAEMSVVQAVVALHGGLLISGRGEAEAPHFTMELLPA